jgi:peroxiredoxin
MTLKAGDALPDVTFMTMTPDGPSKVSTADMFAGKRVVLFAVPGAFTPTCSAKHLPGFVEKAEQLAGKGVDAVACTSVNDVFVMDAWGRDQNAGEKVVMLADGNGDFAQAAGLTMDGTGFGMGVRSQRYALVAKDGVVEQIFVEEPGAFEVSSAEHVLGKL